MRIEDLEFVPHIDYATRHEEAVYNEMKEDGRLYSAESKMSWDNYDINVHVKIPMIFSEQRILEVFQSVLDDLIKVKRKESEDSIWRA